MFHDGQGLVFTNDNATVTSVSTATPAVVTVSAPVTWQTGDEIQLQFSGTVLSSTLGPLRNRQFTITMVDSTALLPRGRRDQHGGRLTPRPTGCRAATTVQAAHLLRLATPWTSPAQWQATRLVQATGYGAAGATVGFMLQGANQPQLIDRDYLA